MLGQVVAYAALLPVLGFSLATICFAIGLLRWLGSSWKLSLAVAISLVAIVSVLFTYVFDVILRRSGAMAVEEIGPIASTFGRLGELMGQWLAQGAFRKDVPLEILVEGVEAFLVQTLALNFCALHKDKSMKARLQPYLRAWLAPSVG